MKTTPDLIQQYGLERLCGATARLEATPGGGWQYTDGKPLRTYRATHSHGEAAAAMLAGLLEAWDGEGGYAVVCGALTMQATRAELASALTYGRKLSPMVAMRDLFRFQMAIRIVGIRAWLLAGADETPIDRALRQLRPPANGAEVAR